jgi:alpha-N-arabinofuranosidase
MLTSKTGLVLQPTYFPMKLYSQECGANYLQTAVASPEFSSKTFANIPYLDISATIDDARKALSLSVVNRHETQSAHTRIVVDGMVLANEVMIHSLTGAPDSENTFAQPAKVKLEQTRVSIPGEKFDYEFPAHSVTMLKLKSI